MATRDAGTETELLTRSMAVVPTTRATAVSPALWTYLMNIADEILVVLSSPAGELAKFIPDAHTIDWNHGSSSRISNVRPFWLWLRIYNAVFVCFKLKLVRLSRRVV